jgi:3-deoxy-D-manno-oct-2-ulosonic acid (Kdo) hydroxylase
MDKLSVFTEDDWQSPFTEGMRKIALQQLEKAQVLYFPNLKFQLNSHEEALFSSFVLNKRTKNISFDLKANRLTGLRCPQQVKMLHQSLLFRFAEVASDFIKRLLPDYAPQLILGRTSYRPVQIKDRKSSLRKNDQLLHVDAFPSQPCYGKRILRLFCNINPYQEARVWHIGENFSQIAPRYLAKIMPPLPGSAWILHRLGITKSLRSHYDHFMLSIHDAMKRDAMYQSHSSYLKQKFLSGSTWIAATDQIAHAAISGQYALEQTFYLPTSAMQNTRHAPLTILENLLDYRLV